MPSAIFPNLKSPTDFAEEPENLISTLRHVTRNVKRWRGGGMIQRWVGLGLLEARAGFRRIKGYRDLGQLVAALRGAGASATRAA